MPPSRLFLVFAAFLSVPLPAPAEEAGAPAKARKKPSAGAAAGNSVPTEADVPYGRHERHVLDFWAAPGDGPRSLVVFIHGGGFTGGDKSKWHGTAELDRLLGAGVSCAAVNYRFRQHAPIQEILRDAARAVQFLRSRSSAWNLDTRRVAGWGGSAGAGTSLWLLARDDLADPAADDPVLRESSKLQAAVLHSTQATYDLTRWDRFLGPGNPAWWHSPDEPAQFYHLRTMADLETENARRILRECDMLHWISPGDGPVFVSNNQPDTPPKDRGHYLHHPAHAREIRNACAAAGVPCVWVQAAERTEGERRPADPVSFVLRALGAASPGAE